jgi:tetratricopeptide (TPR) repeat protein
MTDPAKLYGELIAAFTACRWQEAQALAATLLPQATQHAGVYGIAGVVSLELQQFVEAEEFLRRATELDPARADFATLHAKALAMLGQWQATLVAANKALELAHEDPVTLDALGVIYAKAQAYEQAISTFSRAVIFMPQNAALRFNLAMSLIAKGEGAKAQSELRAAISLDPKYWQAHLVLSQIAQPPPDNDRVQNLQTMLDRHGDDVEACIHLNMALAKEYEDLGDYPRAFHHLSRGKTALGNTRTYSAVRDVALFDALIRAFPPLDSAADVTCSREAPIFIVGMPRSGTTLVERIVTSHPEVYAAGELQNFAMAVQRLSGQQTPLLQTADAIVEAAAAMDWRRLGETYLSSVRLTDRLEPRFVDKMPQNFLYMGFIAKALPQASIICLRRDPMDTCLGNFRQLFDRSTPSFDYSSNLLDTGRYYLLFERLMAHWQMVFPGRILDVNYEELIDHQEAVSRRILDFCRLPWNDACLHFEDNPQPVATFSALEARKPIYKSSVMRWKNYASQTSELKKLLLDAGIDSPE